MNSKKAQNFQRSHERLLFSRSFQNIDSSCSGRFDAPGERWEPPRGRQEWLHASAHRRQEERDGHRSQPPGIWCRSQRRVAERLHSAPPGQSRGSHGYDQPAPSTWRRFELHGKNSTLLKFNTISNTIFPPYRVFQKFLTFLFEVIKGVPKV